MSRYGREDYEDLDDYEDEEQGEDEYEEEEEEAPRQPTQQELEYLELRKQLKDSIRKQMKKENGSSLGHSRERKKLPFDNYGSFFGPSQPVIAPRVIQESLSVLENERLTAKVPKPSHNNKISASTTTSGRSKNQMHVTRPKAVNEIKNKVQNLKVARDYSFLLSDDAELPVPSKDPPRNVSGGPSSDARSARMPPKNKQCSDSNSKQVQNGSRQAQNGYRQVPNGSRQISNGREVKKNVSSAGHMPPRADPRKLSSASKPISKPLDSRKQLASNNGSGPGRPLASKPLPSGTVQKKVPSAGAKSVSHVVPKPSSSKLQSSASKLQSSASKQSSAPKQPLDQRKGYQDHNRRKILSKQPAASSKPQIRKPSTNVPSRPTLQKDRPKKRPARPFSDDEDDLGGGSGVSSIIQKLMGYNPNKYKGRDLEDDSDMEAGFDDILMEEKRSAKIARMEDEEELRKIEEEERRERMRKEAKRRKLSQL